MQLHVIRDWRGLKHKLDAYTTAELMNLMASAQHTHNQVGVFIGRIADEIATREPTSARSSA